MAMANGLWQPTEDDWSKFDKLLENESDSSSSQIQQLSDSSSAGRPNFESFYLISAYSCEDYTGGYSVYRIDVNNTASTLEPIILLDYLYGRAFAIIGSKIYIFGGMNEGCNWSANVFIYDMKTLTPTPTPTRLCQESLQPGPPMKGRKSNPIAVVMCDDSKICVFSKVAYTNRMTTLFSTPSFELFDTITGTWKNLQELPVTDPYVDIYIQSYAVVRRSCLIIQSTQGIYGINVDHTDPKWVYLDGSARTGRFVTEGIWTMVDKILCSPFKVMRRGAQHSFPVAFEPPPTQMMMMKKKRESLIPRDPSGVLCFDERCNNLCVIREGCHTYYIPAVLVDIVKFDDEALRQLDSDLSKWKETQSKKYCTLPLKSIQSDKSCTFALKSIPCDAFRLIACFPIKDTLEGDSWDTTGLQVA